MITTNNNMECPTDSFADLLASKLSHTDVVSSDIQYAMKSIFGASMVNTVTANLMAANDPAKIKAIPREESNAEISSFTHFSGADLKVNYGESTNIELGIQFDCENSSLTGIAHLVQEDFICSVTQSVLGEKIDFGALSGFRTELFGERVNKLSLEFSVDKLGLLRTERLVENFFRENQESMIGNCVIFDAVFDVVCQSAFERFNDTHIRPTLPICRDISEKCFTLESAVHELGAYQSARKQEPRTLNRELFERIMFALNKLYREIYALFDCPSHKKVYPLFMRRMLLSQFQY